MAFEFSRNPRIKEEIIVDGETLVIELDLCEELYLGFYKRYNEILQIKIDFKKLKVDSTAKEMKDFEKTYNKFGLAIAEFGEFLMGTKNLEKLSELYGSNYMELAENIMLFIDEIVKPHMVKYANDKRKKANEKYLKGSK